MLSDIGVVNPLRHSVVVQNVSIKLVRSFQIFEHFVIVCTVPEMQNDQNTESSKLPLHFHSMLLSRLTSQPRAYAGDVSRLSFFISAPQVPMAFRLHFLCLCQFCSGREGLLASNLGELLRPTVA